MTGLTFTRNMKAGKDLDISPIVPHAVHKAYISPSLINII